MEIIFSIPGLGTLALDAIDAMDYPVIQAYVLWSALLYMIVNFTVDGSYRKLYPRIKDEVRA